MLCRQQSSVSTRSGRRYGYEVINFATREQLKMSSKQLRRNAVVIVPLKEYGYTSYASNNLRKNNDGWTSTKIGFESFDESSVLSGKINSHENYIQVNKTKE